MVLRTDILFITRLEAMHDTGTPGLYSDLRMSCAGYPAVLPLLRGLAKGIAPDTIAAELRKQVAKYGTPPFLTPIIINETMQQKNLKVVDISCLPYDLEDVKNELARGVGVIALCTTWLLGMNGAETVRKAAAQLREMAPDIPIIAGGVGVRKGLRARQMMKEGDLPYLTRKDLAREYLLLDALQDSVLDAVIVSEGGENTLADIAMRIREGKDFRDLPNLAIPHRAGYRFTSQVPEPARLDESIIDWRRYKSRLDGFEAPVRTTVGCPYSCQFCDFTGLYKPRTRSLDSLVAELKNLNGTGSPPRRVFFTDDNVALSRRRLQDLTEVFIKEKLGIEWRGFLRADIVDREMARRMRESGCRECLLGIESADPEILAGMDKRLDPEKALEAIHHLDANGIRTQCTFVVGFPGENDKSLQNTASFLSSLPSGTGANALHRYYLFRFQVSPLSAVASPAQRARFGLKGIGEKWSHNTMNASEAADSMRSIYLQVDGPTHMYLEHIPADWPIQVTREVLEARENLQKQVVLGKIKNPLDRLLTVVKEAENKSSQNHCSSMNI